MIIPKEINIVNNNTEKYYCGIDPGVRTFLTVCSNKNMEEKNNSYSEHKTNMEKIKKHDYKIQKLKKLRYYRLRKKRIRKRTLLRIEKRKRDVINNLHYDVINNIVKNYDYIFFEDFKSHEVVKNNENYTIDNLPKGFYFLKLTYNNNSVTKKISVN